MMMVVVMMMRMRRSRRTKMMMMMSRRSVRHGVGQAGNTEQVDAVIFFFPRSLLVYSEALPCMLMPPSQRGGRQATSLAPQAQVER